MASRVSNELKELLGYAAVNFSSDTFKIILLKAGFSYSPASHEKYGDVTTYEVDSGLGYTTAGATLANVALTRSDVDNNLIVSWNNVSWTATGGNIEASGAIIYDDTVAAPTIKPVIGYIDFGGNMLTYDGGILTIANIALELR